MAHLPLRPTLIEITDVSWQGPEGPFRVIDTDHSPEEGWLCVVETPSGDHVTMSPVDVATKANLAAARESTARDVPDHAERWRDVPERERSRAEKRATDLTLMATGDPLGDLATNRARPGHVDPNFDPALVTENVRVGRMSKRLKDHGESGTSVSTLRRQLAQVRKPGGARNLVDDRFGSSRPKQEPGSEIQKDVQRFLSARVDANTVTRDALFDMYVLSHRDDHILDDVDVKAMKSWFLDQATKYRAFNDAPTRRAQAIRDSQTHTGWPPTGPFQNLQLDASPFNGFVLDQYGNVMPKTAIVAAVDPFHSRVRAFEVAGGESPLSSTTVRSLLWSTVAGNYFGDGPDANVLGTSPWLARNVQILTLDRGREFNNIRALGQAAGFNISAVQAPPGMGMSKPHVESAFNPAALLAQWLPGAKGANIRERGRHLESLPMLRIDDLIQIIAVFYMLEMHRPPTDGRANPDYPGLRMSPALAEEQYFRTNGVIEIDPQPHRALELLDSDRRAITDDGITMYNRTYWHPALNDIRDALPGKSPRITVYVDPRRPHAAIVRDVNGLPLLVPEKGSGQPKPVLGDMLDRDKRDMLRGGAIPAADLNRILLQLKEFAQDVAVQPKSGRRRGPELSVRESSDRRQLLLEKFTALDNRHSQDQGSP